MYKYIKHICKYRDNIYFSQCNHNNHPNRTGKTVVACEEHNCPVIHAIFLCNAISRLVKDTHSRSRGQK